ncbi:MAG TPA: ABC transporter permease [Kofleriaceae bacterium]|nr:ABC transporter permease [Kofleriaceae bacterium]
MIRLVLQALGRGCVVIVVALTATFAVLHMVPGDPARLLVGSQADADTLARARAHLGLDEPLAVQYLLMLRNTARGDLGESYRTRRPVSTILAERLWPSVELTVAALLLQLLVGIPLGVMAARRRGRWPDIAIGAGSLLALSTPGFVFGTTLLYVVGYRLGWLPIVGYGQGALQHLAHLVLPALSLAFVGVAMVAQLVRGELVRAMDEDYVRSARAKGLSESRVIWRHALAPVLPPVLAAIGVEFGLLLTGAVAVESIFGWPGLGREALQAVLELDIPLIMGIVIVSAVAITLVNVVVELLQRALNPRLDDEPDPRSNTAP